MAQAAFSYEGDLARLITAAKFGQRWHILPALAHAILPDWRMANPADLLIPLPLHPRRLQERGFNQALEIARPLAKASQISLRIDLLKRIRDTEHQARLHGKARQTNLRGAFFCDRDLSGHSIILVDDIMTTGASLDAAARALKQAGAKRVEVWILARTL